MTFDPLYESYPKPDPMEKPAKLPSWRNEWPAVQIGKIVAGVRDGISAASIAALLNEDGGHPHRSRNAVLGKVFRLREEGLLPPAPERHKAVEHYLLAARASQKRKRPPRPARAPQPYKPPPPPSVPLETVAQLPFLMLRGGVKWRDEKGCAFIAGDPKEFDWCNRPQDGCDYCSTHKAVFYQVYQTPEQRALQRKSTESIRAALKAKKMPGYTHPFKGK